MERYGASIEAANAPSGGAVFRLHLLTEPQVPHELAAANHNAQARRL